MTTLLPEFPRIETRKLAALKPDPANPRVMPTEQMKALKRSVERWGLVEPIVINHDGTVIGGHQRYEALRAMGATEAPCVVLDLDPSDARALNLALNRISGEWDEPKLEALLKDLQGADIDLSLTGFEEQELAALLAEPVLDLDEPPESVRRNIAELEALKAHRKTANEAVADKQDTERYLVIVYASRKAKAAVLAKLGLPENERYIAAENVEIRALRRLVGAKASDGERVGAANPKHSGAGG